MLQGTFARRIASNLTKLLDAKLVYSVVFIVQKMIINLNIVTMSVSLSFLLYSLTCIDNH